MLDIVEFVRQRFSLFQIIFDPLARWLRDESMTLPSSDNLVGKQLSDSYGRYFGTIVGINTDESGSICSIGVDAGCHGFQTINVNQVAFIDDNPVLVSNWKFKAESLIKTSSAAQKRLHALEELHREGEISQAIYEQLVSRNKAQFDLCLKDCDDAVASLNEKTAVLQNEKSVIAAFFGILKLQHRMQEIDDSTYQSTSEHLETILQRNDKEANDISAILDNLTLQEPEQTRETVAVEEPTVSAPVDVPVSEETVAEIETSIPVEQVSEAPTPVILSASADDIPTIVEEVVSVDTDVQVSETVDHMSIDESSSLGSEIPVETPSLDEAPKDSTEQMIEVPAEPTSDETTDLSDRMPVDDSVQEVNEAESSEIRSGEITDSVSFEDSEAEPSDDISSEKVGKTRRNSKQSSDDDITVPTQ